MTKPLEALIARKGNAVTGNYYPAKCENCEEMFTSERMTGGEPIADTGDYGDCYCPHCGTDDSEIIDCGAVGSEAVEAWNFQQKHIDALIAALEQSQRANAAQDDHINQQADRIEQLEKGHQEAARHTTSWRRLAKQNIAEREKDIAELDAARKRIAELEARPVAPIDFKENADADFCREWAWDDIKKDLSTENWSISDGAAFYGFYLMGWDARRQFNEQRKAEALKLFRAAGTVGGE